MGKRLLIILAVILSCMGLFYLSNHTLTAQLNNAIMTNKTKTALKLIEKSNTITLNRSNQHYIDYIVDSIFNIDSSRGYPLCIAAKCGNYKVVKALVKKGVDVNVKTLEKEDTPLILVLRSMHTNKYKIANYLIDNGAKIEYKDKEDMTAVHYAVEQNDNILINDDIIQEREKCLEKCKEILGKDNLDEYTRKVI